MYNPLTIENQMELINQALNNESIINKIENADIYYEEDRETFIKILNSDNLERAFKVYANMDTAARDVFINLVKI